MGFKKMFFCSWILLFSIFVATGCGEAETTVDMSTSEITNGEQTPNDVAPDTATDVASPITLPENISAHTAAFDRSAQENYCLSRTSFYIDENNDLWIWGNLIEQQLTGVLLNDLSKLPSELPQNAIAISSYTPNESNMLDATILYPICVAEDIAFVSNGEDYKATYLVTTDGSLWVPQSDVNPSIRWSDPDNQYVKILDNVQMTENAFGNDMAIDQDGGLWVWGTEKLLSDERISSPIKILDDVASIAFSQNSVAEDFTFVIKKDGSLWGFGSNYCGLWAESTGAHYVEPQKILENVASIDVLYFSSSNHIAIYALRTDGSLWGFGNNVYLAPRHDLLDNSEIHTEPTYTPVKLADNVVDIAFQDIYLEITGPLSVMYLQKADGSLWTWNCQNNLNQDDATSLELIPITENVDSILQNSPFTATLQSDGSLCYWLKNDLINTHDIPTFTITSSKTIKFITLDEDFIFFICEDNTLWKFPLDYSIIGSTGGDISMDTAEKLLDNVKWISDSPPRRFYAMTFDGNLYGYEQDIISEELFPLGIVLP